MVERQVTDEQLTEWEQAASRATEGPWSAADEHGLIEGAEPAWCVSRMQPGYEAMSEIEGYLYDIAYVDNTNEQADAEFIAAARDAVPALIAEVRASRAREAAWQQRWDFQHGVAQGWLANWKAAQQRINEVLAMCEAADTDQVPRLLHVTLLDPRAIRAALTGAAESHGERPSGPGTPAGPVQGGTVQHSGRESGPDA